MSAKFETTYVEKLGLFNNKKMSISLSLTDDVVKGSALKLSESSGHIHQAIIIEYDAITDYGECTFDNITSLRIDTCVRLHNNDWHDSYIFPFEPKHSVKEIIKSLGEHIDKYNAAQQAKIDKQNEFIRRQKEHEERERQYLLELQDFYNKVYKFHINENTPTYTIRQDGTDCFVIFIGEDKSLNFLLIEAKSNTEIHTVISYDEIHYYEKAGAVHFATNINARYTGSQSFGGSFVGGRISVGAVALGGILFGQMGMALGALASYKPAEYTPPTYTPSKFNISSEITKIDERSVILNYYSAQHKQYVDIELPQDIYNFMQTFLPDKKYAIVIEKEKQAAVTNVQSTSTTPQTTEDTAIQRLQKLKQLYEMELITESEYAERKKEILAEI